MFSKLTAATMTLAAVASIVCSVQPVAAQNVSTSGQSDIRQNLDSIQNKITRARAEGRLSGGDAASLQSRLNQCQTIFSTAIADGNINAAERAMLNQQLGALNADARLNVNVYNGGGRWNNDRRDWRDNNARVSIADITARRQELSDRIARLSQKGRLSRREVTKLQRDLDNNVAMEARFKGSSGRIGSRQRQSLMDDLEKLSVQIRAESQDSNYGRGQNNWRNN